ncbi:unnamed protein product [Phytophthora fragariaefolia]|uniref:Unnamed protein product n=1 Tax=Phytophthora fragariaefolia TaxID=1490495 RepID=A0A9W6X2R0_9STRA|nr:unnamed protein product [Phytophthora fragariaefolia]
MMWLRELNPDIDWNTTIQEWTKEMVQAGIIRLSMSAFSAPTFCVKKPIGWHIVHDYRQPNLATILPAIPMPRKEATFDAMPGSHGFSCMEQLWGYYQDRLRECDIPFTAFSTPHGLFKYIGTPMRLRGSPGTFNRLLQNVFEALRAVMRIYFDDIYVFKQSEDVADHFEALDRVLKRCEEQQLYVKLSKCQFCVDEIPCLGDFVGRNGVRMDPDKALDSPSVSGSGNNRQTIPRRHPLIPGPGSVVPENRFIGHLSCTKLSGEKWHLVADELCWDAVPPPLLPPRKCPPPALTTFVANA